MTKAEAFAAAKINLTLHVTGQRPDGYHLLDSLVVFADIGDVIRIDEARDLTLGLSGPMAKGVPVTPDNLVLRAARLAGVDHVHIELIKKLPSAAGIGGGSADAAATLRALRDSYGVAMPSMADVLALGADVPVCLQSKSLRMSGIGENIEPVCGLPSLPAVLVNPGVPVHTPAVFQALADKNGSVMGAVPRFDSVEHCVDWLKKQRNDLEAPAIQICSDIGLCLEALEGQNAMLSRMSGSGATCFGLFKTLNEAETASRIIQSNQSGWWVQPVTLAV